MAVLFFVLLPLDVKVGKWYSFKKKCGDSSSVE